MGSINRWLMHVADLMPTLLEVAGTSYPPRPSMGATRHR